MQIKESAENYLEAILVLGEKLEFVRAADICNYFGYSRPTVSAAILASTTRLLSASNAATSWRKRSLSCSFDGQERDQQIALSREVGMRYSGRQQGPLESAGNKQEQTLRKSIRELEHGEVTDKRTQKKREQLISTEREYV